MNTRTFAIWTLDRHEWKYKASGNLKKIIRLTISKRAEGIRRKGLYSLKHQLGIKSQLFKGQRLLLKL